MAKDKKTADLFARRAGKKRDSQAEGYFSAQQGRPARSGSSRIVTVPLSQILPDPYQPRPILPLAIKEPFVAGELDWREAAERWLAMAAEDPGVAARIETLLELGGTFDAHGQIKPVTGVWEATDGQNVFRLETGERRFWAKALAAVKAGQDEEPHLECREIDGERRSRERQVVENIHAEAPTAVARAREIAALLLSKLDLPPDKDPLQGGAVDEYEYFRSVLDLESLVGRKQMPAGVWDEVEEVMGLQRPPMVRYLQILALPNQLQYQADLHHLSERVLREVLKLPADAWAKAIRKAVEDDLTAAEMKEYVERLLGPGDQKPKRKRRTRTPAERAASRVKLFFKSAREEAVREKLGQVATEFAVGMDKAQILDAAQLLEELAAKLRQRTRD